MTCKIQSWNVNGLRAAVKNGFLDWLAVCDSNVVLLQEVRADLSVLMPEWLEPAGYVSHWFQAEKKGYSGVGIYSRFRPAKGEVFTGLGKPEFDAEGRVLGVVHNNTLFVSVYFPNSQREGARLGYKLAFCDAFLAWLKLRQKEGLDIVVGGDFNISHTEIDLANPKTNTKNAGFLPAERAWISHFIAEGFVDTFRQFEKQGGHYSWWSNRPGVRERNIGWRLDYHFVSESLKGRLQGAGIQAQVLGSDHCPVSLEMENL